LKRIREMLWRLLASTADDVQGGEYEWIELLKPLVPFDSQRAVELLTAAIEHGAYWQQHDASELMKTLARTHPDIVMKELGPLLLNERVKRSSSFQSHREIIANLPAAIVKAWVMEHGADGAAAVARHLPRPFLEPDGNAIVPEITAWLLAEFEQDDEVFDEFCRGSLVRGTSDDEDEEGRIISTDLALAQSVGRVVPLLLSHDLRRIREWARWIQQEIESGTAFHARMDEHIAELRFQSVHW
jgi:hypothetical protein